MLFDASPRISIVVSDSEQACIKHGSELYVTACVGTLPRLAWRKSDEVA
jgi:hypothetical protein